MTDQPPAPQRKQVNLHSQQVSTPSAPGGGQAEAADPGFATRTTTRLLDALKDRTNEPVWEHIDLRYRAVVKGLARRLGVAERDADDVAQQTLAEFVRAFREGRYDRQKGRLSSWILGIAQHISLSSIRRSRRDTLKPLLPEETTATSAALPGEGDEGSLRSVWDEERDRVIMYRALTTLHADSAFDERTLLAFELVALRGVPAAEAAEQSGMTIEQAYVARSRVTRRLRTLVKEMTTAFEEDA